VRCGSKRRHRLTLAPGVVDLESLESYRSSLESETFWALGDERWALNFREPSFQAHALLEGFWHGDCGAERDLTKGRKEGWVGRNQEYSRSLWHSMASVWHMAWHGMRNLGFCYKWLLYDYAGLAMVLLLLVRAWDDLFSLLWRSNRCCGSEMHAFVYGLWFAIKNRREWGGNEDIDVAGEGMRGFVKAVMFVCVDLVVVGV